MSFLQELQERKNNLKTTSTLVKTASGHVYLEQKNQDGCGFSVEKVGSSTGFVVDLKPDLQVAPVIPGLFMGSQDVTQDEVLITKYGITHILSVGVTVPQLPGLDYTNMEVLDLPEFVMKSVFEQSFTVIDSVRKSGGTVFVHCNAGVSRSAAVVIAYLIKHKNLSYAEAYDVLKKSRPCVKPNEGFVKQLKALELFTIK